MIPLVGQPFEFLTWYPTGIIYCNCQDKRVMMVIVGLNNRNACPACRKIYTAVGLTPEGGLIIDCQMTAGAN